MDMIYLLQLFAPIGGKGRVGTLCPRVDILGVFACVAAA
ncbi:hypothetical protein CPter91_3997 [Collimonas pratensis]|uniref:Uncharacterized protein n=1 Tax=Collimonas pratensis TaxID=279113 RepID=A0A127Q8E9_9BURK|nr:hypothetical protein CPter91_3997 [Collimonas pratensis]